MSALAAFPVPSPQWVLTYAGVNISGDVSQMVLSISYCDRLASASGEVEIEFEDREKLWQGVWYPALGDQLNLLIGYHGGELLPCGDFQVDDLVLSGPPDVFRLGCLAVYITPPMRTENSVGYENQSLLEIAESIAAKYGLVLFAAPEVESLVFERITQRRETDLSFLKRLANEHGYDFTVRGSTMVFYAVSALESAPPVATISRTGTERFLFRNRTRRIFAASQVTYFDPDGKQLLLAQVESEAAMPTGDTRKVVTRCENGQEAMLKAQAALHFDNRLFTTVQLVTPGAAGLVAGVNVLLSGWGHFDGIYLVEMARHHLSRAHGYTTEIDARRVS
ncbi:MAG TPA: contractile injection system protein, VgrG/Pvc8 family [Candidatus Binataceae bacterium]|nr:contractile injection system protein, VgrG/Pvc8 family [Candidatus Binataceae bacterium]